MQLGVSIRLECGHTARNEKIQVEYSDKDSPSDQRHLYLHDVFDAIPIIGLDHMYCIKCNNIVNTKSCTIYLAEREVPQFS